MSAAEHPEGGDPGADAGGRGIGGPVGGLLAGAGGLLLAGATAATWVTRAVTRELGGVEVSDAAATSGVEFAPTAVPLGLAGLVGGLLLLVVPGRHALARRLLGIAVSLVGAVGFAAVVLGIAAAGAAEGDLGVNPGLAAFGALAVTAGGAVAARRPRRRPVLDSRYDLDGGDAADDEWGDSTAARDDGS